MVQLHLEIHRSDTENPCVDVPAAPEPPSPEHLDCAVAALLGALELRHPGTCRHAERVAEIALDLTTLVRPELAATEGIGHAYLLHDVGKIGIPDAILLKPGRLSHNEMQIVHAHTRLGEELVRRLRFLSPLVRDVVACHHERWDGEGYPRKLRGPWIPLAARIFSVVDAFDAMTHERPYRDALPAEEAIAEIERCSGTQFDPAVVADFLRLVTDIGLPAEGGRTHLRVAS